MGQGCDTAVWKILVSFPGLATPAFFACSTNMGGKLGLEKLVTCSVIDGCVGEWHIPGETARPSFTHAYRAHAMRPPMKNGLAFNSD